MSRLGPPLLFERGQALTADGLNAIARRADTAERLARASFGAGVVGGYGPAGQVVRPAGVVPAVELGRVVGVTPGVTPGDFDAISYEVYLPSTASTEVASADRRIHRARVYVEGGGVQLFMPAPEGSLVFVYRLPCVEGGPCSGDQVFEVFFEVTNERPVARVCEEGGDP